MIGKYKQSIGAQYTITLNPYTIQAFRKHMWVALLDLSLGACTVDLMVAIFAQHIALPNIKEIGELRIVHIIEEGWISDHSIDAFWGEISVRRITAGEVELPALAELGERPGNVVPQEA